VKPGRIAAVVAVAVLAGGCGLPSLQGVTLPGGKTGSRHLTVRLKDALDLVPQSAVEVANVTVGQVDKVTLDPKTQEAVVELQVEKSTPIPANAQAVLRQTSLLGEKYISLEPPAGQPAEGSLPDNAVIPASDTFDEEQTEDVLSALGDLLNGGGIAQLQSISVELTNATAGREGAIRDLLAQLTTLTGNLDQHKQDIVRALDSLDTLATKLNQQKQTLVNALQDLGPGLKVISDERQDLTTLLTGLNTLGGTAKRVIGETQSETLHDLAALQPTLSRLNEAGDALTGSLQMLLTFPFADSSVNAIPGDYTGLFISLDLDLRQNVPGGLFSASSPLCGTTPIALPIPNPPFCLAAKNSAATKSSSAAPNSSSTKTAPTTATPSAPASSGTSSTPALTLPTVPSSAPAGGSNGLLGSVLGGLL
jgi:phospholipid/cholesterol/gamma-HCH transport system substrate-binding protein